MKKIFGIICLLFIIILSGCQNEMKQRAYEIGRTEKFGETEILVECNTESECFIIHVNNLKYETKFEFLLTIDLKRIDGLEFYDVTKGQSISSIENYTMKEDSIYNISYKNISNYYKNEIKRDNFQIEFYGELWVIYKDLM